MKCCIYPALICGSDFKIKYKSPTFTRIAKTRKGASVLSLFPEFADKIRDAANSNSFAAYRTEKFDGICGFGIIPSHDEIHIVFVPSHFSEAFSENDDVLLTFLKILSEDEADKSKADALARIREKLYADFCNSYGLFAPTVTDVSVLFRDCVNILSRCGSPFGIRLESKIDAESAYLGIVASRLAAELLCMYDMAYSASESGKLVFFANENFGNLVFGFSTDIGESLPLFGICEKYMLSKLADMSGEKLKIVCGGGKFTVALQATTIINSGLSGNDMLLEKLYSEFQEAMEY